MFAKKHLVVSAAALTACVEHTWAPGPGAALPFGQADGWWCPDCARMREEAAKLGFAITSRDIPITLPGRA